MSLEYLLFIAAFVPPFWLAFWWVERRGALANTTERVLIFSLALIVALIVIITALGNAGT